MVVNPQTIILSADGSVSIIPSKLYGVYVSAGATGGLWQLNDSTDDTGTDVISGFVGANSGVYLDFSSTPVQFATGIRADLPGSNQIVTVLFTS